MMHQNSKDNIFTCFSQMCAFQMKKRRIINGINLFQLYIDSSLIPKVEKVD